MALLCQVIMQDNVADSTLLVHIEDMQQIEKSIVIVILKVQM